MLTHSPYDGPDSGRAQHSQSVDGACLANVGADAEQRVQQAGVLERRGLVGEAPEEEAQHDVAPQLAHAVEQCEEPVADHADAARQAAGQPRRQVRSDAVEMQLLQITAHDGQGRSSSEGHQGY